MKNDSINERVARLQSLPQAVIGFACAYPKGHIVPSHRHRRAQLIHAVSGILSVRTPASHWIVPPDRALWVPPGVEHSFKMQSRAEIRTLYVSPAAARDYPRQPTALVVTPLLRELIVAAAQRDTDTPLDGRARLIISLALLEMTACVKEPLSLPMPSDRQLLKFATMALDAADKEELPALATRVGLGYRTLARRFVDEIGMTPGAWRQQARLLTALGALMDAKSVTQVALDAGYDSPSSFTAAFRRVFGTSPRMYLRARRGK